MSLEVQPSMSETHGASSREKLFVQVIEGSRGRRKGGGGCHLSSAADRKKLDNPRNHISNPSS